MPEGNRPVHADIGGDGCVGSTSQPGPNSTAWRARAEVTLRGLTRSRTLFTCQFRSSRLIPIANKQPQALLAPIDGGHTQAFVEMTLYGRRMHVTSSFTGITGKAAWLVIPTTVGDGGLARAPSTPPPAWGRACAKIFGDPLIGTGGVATLSVDAVAVAGAKMRHGSGDD